MKVIRVNSKNVILIFFALLSHIIREVHMCYDRIISYALKESNANSTPAYSSKKEEMSGLCPAGILCSELRVECLKCNLNTNCVYGAIYVANCTVLENVDCIGEQNFQKEYICRYCYQTEPWEHQCHLKNSCSSVASPQQYYRTNCTVNGYILCLGKRKFMKNLRCNWTVGYRWSTALILSITLGGFGADRFYLGHWQEGIGKLFSFGGLGVWTLIDVILISMRYLGPADGSLYI
ncbi:TM2 domain-containing protein almondex isoform X2 [Vespula pensylvanica]|uniref:TM2 domain-containing protein almondex isoform X2 n=1 Tax=Vespula pensylvanica TaxID=30213 RepID=UPI001CBA2D80|nr:TM2 domain-containing protein almondex isoform X2 [Vespula pensylvanica]XP_050857050.1 TM2 domain-containing protein almondex isoform X2 [Vespula vulgaris]